MTIVEEKLTIDLTSTLTTVTGCDSRSDPCVQIQGGDELARNRRRHLNVFDNTELERALTLGEYDTDGGTPANCICGCQRPADGLYGDGLAHYCRDLAWYREQRP